MKKILISLLAFLVIGGCLQAQTTMTMIEEAVVVDDVEITPGGEVTVTVKLAKLPEDGTLRGLQMDLYLPDGFSLKKFDDGERYIDVELSSDQDQAFSVEGQTVLDEDENEIPQQVRFLMTVLSRTKKLKIGDLFTFTLVAADDVEPNTYPAVLAGVNGEESNIKLSGKNGSTTYQQEPFTFYIKMPIELSEEKSYAEGFGNYTNAKVIMNKRTLKADTWNTICFPFDMDEDAIKEAFGEDNEVTIAELMGSETKKKDEKVQSIIIKFNTKSTTTISANTPYLIKLSEAVDVFAVEGVNLSDDQRPSSVSGGDCTFYGNYDVIEDLGADTPVLFISGNKFYYATGKTTMKSFRGYFTHTDLSEYIQNQAAGSNISIFVDDQPTGIRNIVTNQGSENVYDISGRKVNNDNKQKGVYIVNGKKETVR